MKNLAYNPNPADKNADGIGLSELRGAKLSIIDGFFFAQHVFSSTGDRAGEPKGSPVTLSRQSNPARSSTPIGLGMVDSKSTKRNIQMYRFLHRAAALALAIPIRRNRAGGASC